MPDIGLLQGPVRPRVALVSLPPGPAAEPIAATLVAEPVLLQVAARSAPAEFAILLAPAEPESAIAVSLPVPEPAQVVSTSSPEPARPVETPVVRTIAS